VIIQEVDVGEVTRMIQQHASESSNEEELKIRVESSLRPVLQKWGIQWASYEHRNEALGGRKDSLYGRVIIEYKSPGKLNSKTEFKKAKEQVQDYILVQGQTEDDYGKYLGIVMDGYRIGFVRFRNHTWEVQNDPLPINSQTVMKMLQAIRALRRKPLDVEFLLTDLGPKSVISKKIIQILYHSLVDPNTARTDMLFNDWKRVFSQACSFSPEKLPKLINYYELEKDKKLNLEKLLFAIHTYYTILMKLLTSEIVTLFADSLLGSYLKAIEESYYRNHKLMLGELQELEEGGIFATIGIKNFLEADYFAWYLDEWNSDLANAIADLVSVLLEYEPATVELNPERVKDLFKRLYQNLVPKEIRHSLGEYFTPDWLVELVLDEIGYDGNPDKRILDPSCGSGTFLVLEIKRIKEYASSNFIDQRTLITKIINNVQGIDLNPLGILASKANYLIALSDLLRYRPKDGIDIPIYLADSVSLERGQKWQNLDEKEEEFRMFTTEGEFWLPSEVIQKKVLHTVLAMIDGAVRMKMKESEFIRFLSDGLKSEINLTRASIGRIGRLYKKIYSLEYRYKKDRIWTQLLKNSFAPLLIGRFNYVVGNPPWINWEHLPEFYRTITKDLWNRYSLLGKTKGTGLGKVKRDISMLFVARCFDQYVAKEGKLAFLVPLTNFKMQAGGGFRKWLSSNCSIEKIHDIVELFPFEGATNRTSILIISEGMTSFPFPSMMWSNPSKVPINMEDDLESVKRRTKRFSMITTPVKAGSPESSWMITSEEARQGLRKITGEPSKYNAHMGIKTALNQAFWITILSHQPNGILVKNPVLPGQKKTIREIRKLIEPELIYPFVRGRDLDRWYIKNSGNLMIVPHYSNGKPIEERELKLKYPKTYEYFFALKTDLLDRSIHRLWGKTNPFYSLYDIGDHSYAPYKVAWKEIAGEISGKGTSFAAAVLESSKVPSSNIPKPTVPDNKLITIPFEDKSEAYYVCGILNSSPVRTLIASYAYETAMDTHIVKNISVPEFDQNNPLHMQLSNLAQKAHTLAIAVHTDNNLKDKNQLMSTENQIDDVVSNIFKISTKELKQLKTTLDILKSGEDTEQLISS
jgi:hypothetical protein